MLGEGWVRNMSCGNHYGKDWFGRESSVGTKSRVVGVGEDWDIYMLSKDLPTDGLLISR